MGASINVSRKTQPPIRRIQPDPLPPRKPGAVSPEPNDMLSAHEEPSASLFLIGALLTALILYYPLHHIGRAYWLLGKEMNKRRGKVLAAVLVIVSGAVILFALAVILGGLARSMAAQRYEMAFEPPLNLGDRPAPSADASTYGLLPMTVGDFAQDLNSNVPEMTLSRLPRTSIDESVVSLYHRPTGETVAVTAARMSASEWAKFTMRQLKDYASQYGSVGNFAFDLGATYYLYFRIGDTSALAWERGNWVFIVSGTSLADVNSFVGSFPY